MVRVILCLGLVLVAARGAEMPGKAAEYHAALVKRPESAVLFERFRGAWLEERSTEELEAELSARANAGEQGAWATLARERLIAGRSEAALEAFAKARDQTRAAWLDLEIARLRMAARDFEVAEKDALQVPVGDARRPEALKLAGLACLRAERVDDKT
jgi:tetratricopeptide (TPR) repeat protein